jgi:hypothetical protein
MVDAMTALRNCALWSDADSAPYVVAVAIGLPLVVSLPENRLSRVHFLLM